MKQYDVEEYVEPDGKVPFREWLLNLKDGTARAKVTARIDRASHGNFGDWKALKNAKGVFEMREHYGPGYRIFYALIGNKMILLLAGSAKKDQKKMIALASRRLLTYEARRKDDDQRT